MHCSNFAAVVTGMILFLSASGWAADWPQFRGPGARGVAENAKIPLNWDSATNVAWTADVPGLGWSSPVVAGDRVYLTTCISDSGHEVPELGFYLGKTRGGDRLRWSVLCYSLPTGKLLWQQEAHSGSSAPIHLKNSHASATPVTDGKRVYVWFGSIGLFCMDAASGKPVWSAPKLGGRRTRHDWGSGASPALHGESIYLVNDNEEESFVVALNNSTGQELWRKPRARETNWSTPFLWTHAQRTELIVPGTARTISYDPATGEENWSLTGASSITIPTPFAAHGLLFVASGYFGDKLRPLFAVKPGAKGDITPSSEQTQSEHIAWLNRAAAPYNPSPLVYGDQLYVLLDQGFLASYDAKTGTEIYEKQRIHTGGIANFTASPWAAAGHIFCLSETGDTFVVQPGPEFRVLRKNSLGEPCLATPAIAGDRLLIRTAGKLYCISSTKQPATPEPRK